MTDYTSILNILLQISLTTAALTIPAISVAYFLIDKGVEVGRMSKIIGYGSISAIILIICSLVTLAILCFGQNESIICFGASSVLFVIGCLLLLYILLIIAGFKRELPLPAPTVNKEKENKRV